MAGWPLGSQARYGSGPLFRRLQPACAVLVGFEVERLQRRWLLADGGKAWWL